ncbi:MAG: hypothetical protein ACP5FZ_11570, partial [Fidelibacterota bacterium]
LPTYQSYGLAVIRKGQNPVRDDISVNSKPKSKPNPFRGDMMVTVPPLTGLIGFVVRMKLPTYQSYGLAVIRKGQNPVRDDISVVTGAGSPQEKRRVHYHQRFHSAFL